jgi:hypothetical protein
MAKNIQENWKRVVSARVSPTIAEELKIRAEKEGETIGKIVEAALMLLLNKERPEELPQLSSKKWPGELVLLSNKEAAEICKLSIGTLNNYRTSKRFKDKGLVEGIHWLRQGIRTIKWVEEPTIHWASNTLLDHRRWLRSKLKNG